MKITIKEFNKLKTGDKVTCTICGVSITATVHREDDKVWLCQDAFPGDESPDKHGYKYSRKITSDTIELYKVELIENEFVRGEKVLVSDTINCNGQERIFIAHIEGAEKPYLCLAMGQEELYYKGRSFAFVPWKYCKKKPNFAPVKVKIDDELTAVFYEDYVNVEGVRMSFDLLKKITAIMQKVTKSS